VSKRFLGILLLGLFLNCSLLAVASVEKGKELYTSCVQCHGDKGLGNAAEQAPMIAGQYDWYIISSVKAFKAGVERKNPKMLPYIKNLSDQDITDLAAYVSSL
jgi:cytochrome c553